MKERKGASPFQEVDVFFGVGVGELELKVEGKFSELRLRRWRHALDLRFSSATPRAVSQVPHT